MQSLDEARLLARLTTLQAKASRQGFRALAAGELDELQRLYRFASSQLSRHETRAGSAHKTLELRALVLATHGLLYGANEGEQRGFWRRLYQLYTQTSPRASRSEWRLLLVSFGLIYGLALVAFVLVSRDLSLAPAFLDRRIVENQIAQLEELQPGEDFRGNFNFGLNVSSSTSGGIMGNNLQVALLFFASALLPPFYLFILAANGLMLGTYTAVAGHWQQAGEISSILWCHGTLEVQAIVFAGSAGLALARGLMMPGPWTRSYALRLAGRRALLLLAPAVPMLVLAGLIEGFISPHAGLGVRLTVAVSSGAALVAWFAFAGREACVPNAPTLVQVGGSAVQTMQILERSGVALERR